MIVQKEIFDKDLLKVADPIWFKTNPSDKFRAGIIKFVGEDIIDLIAINEENGLQECIEIYLNKVKTHEHQLMTMCAYVESLMPEELEEEKPKKDHTDCANILDAQCYHGAEIEILDGNILCIESRNCACGAFEDRIKIEYCPICGEKL